MATQIYTEETLLTQGGTEIVVRPLTIKSLRKFMAKMNELQTEEEIADEEGINVMLEAALIAIEQCNKNLENLDELEDELDLPTISKILEVSGGIKLDDPNLQVAQRA